MAPILQESLQRYILHRICVADTTDIVEGNIELPRPQPEGDGRRRAPVALIALGALARNAVRTHRLRAGLQLLSRNHEDTLP
jgi:hypothetical protein